MWKSILIIFAFGFNYTGVNGQTNYLPYFQKWLKVESLALVDRMEEAEQLILECFADYEVPFASDLVLAAQVDAINGHDSLSVLWIEKALKRGVKYTCINSMRVFDKLQKKPQWDSLKSKVKKLEYEYATTIRFDLNKEFMQRFHLEQQAKRKPRYEEVVTSNFNRIKEVTGTTGFPGERLVGLDLGTADGKLESCDYSNRKIIVTFLHYPYSFSTFHEELLLALKNGDLHPDNFLYIYSFESRKDSALYSKIRKPEIELADYEFLLGKKDMTQSEIIQINTARYELGIGPLRTRDDFVNRKAIFDKYGILVGSM